MRGGGNVQILENHGASGKSQNKKEITTGKFPEKQKFVKVERVTYGSQMGGIHMK